MTESILVQIADAIVASLLDVRETFSMEVWPEKAFSAEFDRANLREPFVTVTPRSETEQLEGRGVSRHEYIVRIDIRCGLTGKTSAEKEEEFALLVKLVEEIKDHLRKRAMANADWTGTINDPLYDDESLSSLTQFESQIDLTYLKFRSI